MTVGQTAVTQSDPENYHTFTVIIPGDKLKVSRRFASGFQSKGRQKKLGLANLSQHFSSAPSQPQSISAGRWSAEFSSCIHGHICLGCSDCKKTYS